MTARGCLKLPSCAESGLRIASLTDLLAQKLIAMSQRITDRDGLDVSALLELALDGLYDESGYGLGPNAWDTLQALLSDLENTPWHTLQPQMNIVRDALHPA